MQAAAARPVQVIARHLSWEECRSNLKNDARIPLTDEHVHHIIKSELGGGVYPSGKHGANAAWLRLQVITHNLLQMLKAAVLPQEYANAEPKRLRFAVFTGLGQIVYHARRVILKVLEELWATLIRAAQERAMALSPPVC